ncbi:MAG: glycosyltransferase [Desulfobacteraceae bacterium]|nr:glycosyltransferase [Desulfobacteraceae bacterium]
MGAFGCGGRARMLSCLMNELSNKGHNIFAYFYDKQWKSNIYSGFHYFKINSGFRNIIKSVKELTAIIKSDDIDCMLTIDQRLAEKLSLISLLLNIPIILSERTDPKRKYTKLNSRLHRLLEKLCFYFADGIVFQTETAKNHYIKHIRNKSIVIQNPILDDRLPFVDYNKRKKKIVITAALLEVKNVQLLIDSFSEIDTNEYELKIYGDGLLKKQLSKSIKQHKMEHKIFLMGNVESVVDHIANASIFVLCSNLEGMPNALIEAMSVGLPCISTDVPSGGTKALINNNTNGYLIPVGDKKALKERLNILINNASLRKQIGKEALKIRETNSKEIIIKQWEDYLISIVNKI